MIIFVQPLVSLMWSDQARYITTSLRSFLMDLLGKGSPFIHDNFARADMGTGIIPVDLLFSDVSKTKLELAIITLQRHIVKNLLVFQVQSH